MLGTTCDLTNIAGFQQDFIELIRLIKRFENYPSIFAA